MKTLIILLIILMLIPTVLFARDIEKINKIIPLGNEEMIRVEMDLALVDLLVSAGKSKDILNAEVSYDADKIRPIIDYTAGKTGFLWIESKKRGSYKDIKHLENEWDLEFTTKVPLEFSMDIGLGDCNFDLTDLVITDMDIEVGLVEMRIKFDSPNKERINRMRIESGLGEFVAEGLLNANVESFDYSGGLGSSELYFTGKCSNYCEADIEVGLGSVEIYIEKGIPVKVYSEGSFLSSIDIEDMKKVKKGVYISRNWDENTNNRLELHLEVGLGSIDVKWY
jgi:hypothetical protein